MRPAESRGAIPRDINSAAAPCPAEGFAPTGQGRTNKGAGRGCPGLPRGPLPTEVRAKIAAAASRRAPEFDADMARIARDGWRRGRDVDTVADEIGVGRDAVRRFWRANGMGNRRRIPGFYRWGRSGDFRRGTDQ